MRRLGTLAAPLCLCVALWAPSGADAATVCSYSSATDTLAVTGDPDVGTHLAVYAPTGEIKVFHAAAAGLFAIDCGATDPTTTNTDTITVSHTSPDEATRLQIGDLEAFAPGVTDEGGVACPDEIEIEVALGGHADMIFLFDSNSTANDILIGGDGVDLNASGTLCDDLELADLDGSSFTVWGGGGADVISANGGGVTGPVGLGVFGVQIEGGPGADILRGGGSADELSGGAGKDKLLGMGGLDRLFAEDGKRDARIDCGPGAAVGEGALFDRRKDPRPQSC